MGKARATITNSLRLLKLPKEIQDEIKNGRITYAHGRALLEIEDENLQRRLTQEIISKGLSVRETENLVKHRRVKSSASQRHGHARVREPVVSVLEHELQRCLATKVRIVEKKKRGHISVDYYSLDDLKRIVNKICGGQA